MLYLRDQELGVHLMHSHNNHKQSNLGRVETTRPPDHGRVVFSGEFFGRVVFWSGVQKTHQLL